MRHFGLSRALLTILVAVAALGLSAGGAAAAVTMQIVDSHYDEQRNVNGTVNFNRYTALAAMDIDADGLPDIVSTGELRERSDFWYARPTPFGMPNLDGPVSRLSCGGCAPPPVDGLASAVVGGKPWLAAFDPGSLGLDFFGTREGTIDQQDDVVLAANVQSVAIGDVNGDGVPDLVVLLADGVVQAIPGELEGAPSRVTHDPADAIPLGTVAGEPVVLRLADVAGSSLADVVVLTDGTTLQQRVRVATATGSAPPTFSGFQSFATPADPRDMELADFDGDGRRDVVISTDTGVSVARNETGTGGQVVGATSTRSFNLIPDVAVLDVDGDGTPEIAAGMASTLAVALLDVTGTSPAVPEVFDTVNGVERLIAADLDGDGADEIIMSGIGVDVLTNVSPGSMGASPSAAALGAVEVGRVGGPVGVTLTNQREGTERVRSVRVEGPAAFEVLVTDTCNSVLDPGAQCGLTARLSPSVIGARSAQVRVDFQHAPDLVIPVTGDGTAAAPGPAGPPGPAGETQRAAVLTRVACVRRGRTKVRCTLRLASQTDVAGSIRMLVGRRAVGRARLRARATRVTVNGSVPAARRSVVVELRLPGLAAQRVTVAVPRRRR